MSLAMRKNTLKKKQVSTGFCRVSRVMGQPGRSTGFLLIPVFCLTWTGPAIGSIGSRVDLPGQFRFNNYDIVWAASLAGYLVLV